MATSTFQGASVKLSAQAAREMVEGDKPLKDHVVKGLELHAGARGKTWRFYYRNAAGERRRPKVGDFPTLSLEDARAIAKEWYETVKRGGDPSRDRQTYRASPTLAEFCETYMQQWSAVYDRPRTIEEKRSKIEQHIKPLLGKLKVVDAKLSDINEALERVAKPALVEVESKKGLKFKRIKGGATAAQHVRCLLSSIFAYAEHDDVKLRPRHSNPVRDARTFAGKKRRRHMKAGEAPAVAHELDALAVEYPARVAALWCILLAGTRVTELVTARRSQLRGNVLYLDEHKTMRTGDERVIVLPRQALALIETLPDDNSGYIFGQGLTRYNVFTVWDKARCKAGCPDLRMQDFRRTFASAAKSAGRSLETVGELFGHKHLATMENYAFLFDEAAETAAQDTANELEKRMRPESAKGDASTEG